MSDGPGKVVVLFSRTYTQVCEQERVMRSLRSMCIRQFFCEVYRKSKRLATMQAQVENTCAKRGRFGYSFAGPSPVYLSRHGSAIANSRARRALVCVVNELAGGFGVV